MNEQELKCLKEQIKQELLAEINTKKENENSWKKIKDEYKDEFSKFDFTEHSQWIDCDEILHTKDEEVSAIYPMQNAIGTLLKIVFKSKTIAKMNVPYEELKDVVEKILKILKEKAEIE